MALRMDPSKSLSSEEKAQKVQKGREIFEQLRLQKANSVRGFSATSDASQKEQVQQITERPTSKAPKQGNLAKSAQSSPRHETNLEASSPAKQSKPRAAYEKPEPVHLNQPPAPTLSIVEQPISKSNRNVGGDDLNQRISSLMKEQNSLKSIHQREISEYSSKIATLQSQTASLHARIELLEEELVSKDMDLRKFHESELKMRADLEQNNAELISSNVELGGLKDQKLAMEKEIQELKRKISSVESHLKCETEENARLLKKVKDEMMVIDMLRAENKSYQQRCERAVAELTASTEHIISLQRQLEASSQQGTASLVEEIKELNRQLQKAQEEKSTSLIRLNKLDFDNRELLKEKDSLSAQLLIAAADQKAALSECIDNYEAQLKGVESQISALKEENHELQKEIRNHKTNLPEAIITNQRTADNEMLQERAQYGALVMKDMHSKLVYSENHSRTSEDQLSPEKMSTIATLQDKVSSLERQLQAMTEERNELSSTLESKGSRSRQFNLYSSEEGLLSTRTTIEFKNEKARLTSRITSLESEITSLEDSKRNLQAHIQSITNRFQNYQKDSESRFNVASLNWESIKKEYERRLAEMEDELHSLQSKHSYQLNSSQQGPNKYESYAGALVQAKNPEILEMEIETLKRKCKSLSDENLKYEELISDLTREKKSRPFLSQQNSFMFTSMPDSQQVYFVGRGSEATKIENYYSERDIPSLLGTIRRLEDELQSYSVRFLSFPSEKEKSFTERHQTPSIASVRWEEQKLKYESEKMELTLLIRNQEQEIESLNQKIRSLTKKSNELEVSLSELQSSRMIQTSRYDTVGQQEGMRHLLTFQSSMYDLRTRVDEYQKDIITLNEKLAEANSQIKIEKMKGDAAATEKMQLLSRLRDGQTTLSDLQTENSKLQTEIRRIMHEKALLEANAQHYANAETFVNELSKKIESQYETIIQLETNNRSLQLEVSGLKYANSDKDRIIIDFKEHEADIQDRLEETLNKVRSLTSSNDELQIQVQSMEANQQALLNDLQSNRILKSHMEREIDELRNLLLSNQSPNLASNEERQTLEQRVNTLLSEKSSLNKQITSLTERISESKFHLESSRAKIVELEAQLQESRNSKDQVFSELSLVLKKNQELQNENQELRDTVYSIRGVASLTPVPRHFQMQGQKFTHAEVNDSKIVPDLPTENGKDGKDNQNIAIGIGYSSIDHQETFHDQQDAFMLQESKLREYESFIMLSQGILRGLIDDMNRVIKENAHAEFQRTEESRAFGSPHLMLLMDELRAAWLSEKHRAHSELVAEQLYAFDMLREIDVALSRHIHNQNNVTLETPSVSNEGFVIEETYISEDRAKLAKMIEMKKEEILRCITGMNEIQDIREAAVSSKARSLGITFTRDPLPKMNEEHDTNIRADQQNVVELREIISDLKKENEELSRKASNCCLEISSLKDLEKRYARARKIWDQEVSCLHEERDSTKRLVEVTSLSRTTSYVEASNSTYASMKMLSTRTSYDDTFLGSSRKYAQYQPESTKISYLESINQNLQRELVSLREYWDREKKVYEMERACFEEEKKTWKKEIEMLEKKCKEEVKLEATKVQSVQHQYNALMEQQKDLIHLTSDLTVEIQRLKAQHGKRVLGISFHEIPTVERGPTQSKSSSRSISSFTKSRSFPIHRPSDGESNKEASLSIEEQLRKILEKYGENDDGIGRNGFVPPSEELSASHRVNLNSEYLEYEYEFQPTTDRKSKRSSDTYRGSQPKEVDEFKKQASELQIILAGLQHITDSILLVLKVDMSTYPLIQRMEYIHEYVRTLTEKQNNVGYLIKELKCAQNALLKLQDQRTSLIEQKKYLTNQLELQHFLDAVNPRACIMSNPSLPQKSMKKRTTFKCIVIGVLAISRLRTCRMNSIISETQQCTWGSVDDADYISSQIQQRDDIIRHLKARLQRFEVQSSSKVISSEIHVPDRKSRNLAREFSREAFYEQANQKLREELLMKDNLIKELSKQVEAAALQPRSQRGTPYPQHRQYDADHSDYFIRNTYSYSQECTPTQSREETRSPFRRDTGFSNKQWSLQTE